MESTKLQNPYFIRPQIPNPEVMSKRSIMSHK